MRPPLAIAVALLTAACGSAYGSEHQILSNFFRAARVRDLVVTSTLSSVPFEPHIAGSVQDFTITSVVQRERSEVVTVDASVRTPDGTTVPRQLVITLEPASREQTTATAGSRWLITSIR